MGLIIVDDAVRGVRLAFFVYLVEVYFEASALSVYKLIIAGPFMGSLWLMLVVFIIEQNMGSLLLEFFLLVRVGLVVGKVDQLLLDDHFKGSFNKQAKHQRAEFDLGGQTKKQHRQNIIEHLVFCDILVLLCGF